MLAWSKRLNRPYESSWALIQRFRVLNLPSTQELGRLFGHVPSGREAGWFKLEARYSDSSDFSLQHLASTFGLESDALEQLFPEGFHMDRYCESDGYLKFCPDCLALGYHSTVHQAVALRLCPAHRTVLRTKCPGCDLPLHYGLKPSAFPQPFACGCGQELAPTADLAVLTSPLPDHVVSRFRAFASYARQIEEDPRRRVWPFDIVVSGTPELSAYAVLARALGLPGDYSDLFEQNPPILASKEYCPQRPARPLFMVQGESKSNDPVAYSNRRRIQSILVRAFRSYDRRLRKLLVGNHEVCLRALALIPNFTEIRFAPDACPVALAYARWRYYWLQRRPPPNHDFKPEGALTEYATGLLEAARVWEGWWKTSAGPEGNPQTSFWAMRWAIRRTFLMALQQTFLSALILSEKEREQGLDPVNRHWPGIGDWAYPRVYVLMGSSGGGGATLYSHSPFKGVAEVKKAVGKVEAHRHGAFRIFKSLQTWYYQAPQMPST